MTLQTAALLDQRGNIIRALEIKKLRNGAYKVCADTSVLKEEIK